MPARGLPRFPMLLGLVVLVGLLLLIANLLSEDTSISGDGHLERIDSFVRKQLDASRIPGASIATVQDGELIHARGFGEDGNGNALTAQTPMWIGSNTKSFTALAVMQLVEQGRLDLDAPVQTYLPEFTTADPQAAAQITLRHLLNQTSGFSRSDGARLVLEQKQQTLAEAVAAMADVELNRPVGESFEYSNLNYVVLGRVVEAVSGESWPDYVQSHIFEPLGMTNSYTDAEAARDAGLSETHAFVFGLPVESDVTYLEGLAPTGYLIASAEDMARYLAMYLRGGETPGGRLLSQVGIEQMLTPATNPTTRTLQGTEFDYRYGMGWFVGPFGAAQDARWHLGNLPNFTAWMVLLPETNQGVVVLINAGSQMELLGANSVMSRIPVGIVDILRGETPPSGLSITRFYIIFDTLVVLVLALIVWSLVRVVLGRLGPSGEPERWRAGSWALASLPLLWEVGLSLYLLLAYPSSLQLTWPGAIRSLPDLNLVLLAVGLLWLATGIARTVRLAVVLVRRRQPAAVPASA